MSRRGKRKARKIVCVLHVEITNVRAFLSYAKRFLHNMDWNCSADVKLQDAVSEACLDMNQTIDGFEVVGTATHEVEWFEFDEIVDRAHPDYRKPVRLPMDSTPKVRG